jgi:hypothetical protein
MATTIPAAARAISQHDWAELWWETLAVRAITTPVVAIFVPAISFFGFCGTKSRSHCSFSRGHGFDQPSEP